MSVIWTYSGLDADDMSKRIVGICERAISTTVNNVQYTDSQSYSGVGVIKVHFQPGVRVDLAIAQVTVLAQSVVHLMPPGTLPPFVSKYDASSVPIVQVSLGGEGLSQTELYDLGQNFIRGQLATINGTSVPLPYGGQQRSIMVDLEPGQLAANHLTAEDISGTLNNQNLVTPSGTEKIGDREYLVGTNSSDSTVAELNSLPIRTMNGAVVQMKDVAWVHNAFRLQKRVLQVHHDLALLSPVGVWNSGPGYRNQLWPKKVQGLIIQVGFAQPRAGQRELQHRHIRSRVVDNQGRQCTGRQPAQNAL
jgi:multidrug efflux pump subunit AcrB